MKTVVVGALALFLAGCAVGPNYRRPMVPAPPQWTAPQTRGVAKGVESETDLWWKSFRDGELDSLIQRAVEANYDLQLATARVEEARAATGLARSNYFPQVGAGAAVTRVRQIGVGLAPSRSPQRFNYETNAYDINANLSWEIDLFGRIRRRDEEAKGDLVASEQDRRNVLITVFGDVARYYSELRGAQLRLEITKKNIATAEDTLALTKARVAGGQATERDVAQAEGELESVRSQVPRLNTDIKLAIHRLGVLVGKQPGELEEELSKQAAVPPVPPDVPTGIPSDLLARRPDIGSAEAQLIAATARVGVAKADYFPRFTLLGNAGREATQLHDLSLGFGNYFGVGPTLSLPVFTGGRIRSNVEIQNARVRQTAAIYKSTILRAFEETENALVAYANEQDRRDRLEATVRSDETSFDLANVQYKAGLTDFLTVLDAQRQMYTNQDLLAQSQTSVTTNLIALYRALGGGWSISPNAPVGIAVEPAAANSNPNYLEVKPMKLLFPSLMPLFPLASVALAQPPSPQPPSGAPSPKTTEMMVILTPKAGVTRQQIMTIMLAEIRATVKLYLDGKIRQWYSRGDGKGVVFFLDARTVEEAHAIMEILPLSKENLMEHEYIPVGPLMPLAGLLGGGPTRE